MVGIDSYAALILKHGVVAKGVLGPVGLLIYVKNQFFSDRPFSTTDPFSGDMNNLRLFSQETASLISRTFNDAALMTAKQGVSFSGVIKGAVSKWSSNDLITQ